MRMTVEEARKLYEQYKKELHSDNSHENEEALVEIMTFLAERTNDPWYTSDLGGYYYGKRQFDLALKYYERTYELGDHEIAACLGYIWYYGRTGTVDYEKAFRYFSEAADLGNDDGKRKLADMYRYGHFVRKDVQKYREMIEELYERHKDDEYPFIELPDLCTRVAEIRSEDGDRPEAVRLYLQAKSLLPMRLQLLEFFGDIHVMDRLVNDLYALIEPDYADLDLFDLFYLLKEPAAVTFRFQRTKYAVTSSFENGEYGVCFEGRWYRSVKALFENAMLEGKPIFARYREIYDVEVNHDRTH